MDKKKIILISTLIIVGVIIIFLAINLNSKNKEDKANLTKNATVELLQVFEIDDIEKSKHEIVENDEIEVASKYLTSSNIFELNANVKFDEDKGRMIYIREDYEKVNIYQEEHELNKYEDKNIKIQEIMTEFEQKCQMYLNANDETDVREQLYGESTAKGKIPVVESIYDENRLYSKTYTIEDEIDKTNKEYDINFYRSDEKIICEFAYYI